MPAMTTYQEPPQPFEIDDDGYFKDWVDFSVRHIVAHLMGVLVAIATVLFCHGAGLVVLPWPVLLIVLPGLAFLYLFITINPTRLEPKFHKRYPYSAYAEPPE